LAPTIPSLKNIFDNILVREQVKGATVKPLTDEIAERAGQKASAWIQNHLEHRSIIWNNTQIEIPSPKFTNIDMETVQEILEHAVSESATHVHTHKIPYLLGLLAATIICTFGYVMWQRRQDTE
jgi:hypothetical protein